MKFAEIRAMLKVNATRPDKRAALRAAARLALVVAARLQAAATREERRRREEAKRIAADGEAALSEFISGWPALAHAEEEAILSGRNLPRRLLHERAMYYRLRHEAGEAVLCADPAGRPPGGRRRPTPGGGGRMMAAVGGCPRPKPYPNPVQPSPNFRSTPASISRDSNLAGDPVACRGKLPHP